VGNIYVASSHTTTGGVKDFAVTKFLPNGTIDAQNFGNAGTATVDFGSDDIAYDIELLETGKLYVVGTTATVTKSWAVCSLNLDGTLNTTFNGTGKKSGFQTGQLNAIYSNQELGTSGNLLLAVVDLHGAVTVYA